MRAELKRCIFIERRWNRNVVLRGSPDKVVNRRPTSLRKFRADAVNGPQKQSVGRCSPNERQSISTPS